MSAEERRFTLLTLLSRAPASAIEIAQLPAYAGKSGKALQRMIERDIQTLRDSGNTITVDENYRYRVDESRQIVIDVSGLDVSILRRILGTKRRNNVEAFAQFGAAKVLGSGTISDKITPYRLNVPNGESVIDVARAMSEHRRMRFRYHRSTSVTQYILEPWQVTVHFGAFYVHGAVVERDGIQVDGQIRTFKLSRIESKVEVLDQACTLPVTDQVDSELAPVDIVLFVSDPQAPLARRGKIIDQRDGELL